MSPAYVTGATEHFPQARIVFDKFHLMVLAGLCAGSFSVRVAQISKARCGACGAMLGTSVSNVKSNVKISVVSTPNLAVR